MLIQRTFDNQFQSKLEWLTKAKNQEIQYLNVTVKNSSALFVNNNIRISSPKYQAQNLRMNTKINNICMFMNVSITLDLVITLKHKK